MRALDVRSIGRRIAGRRVEKALTQQQLADVAGISQRTIATLETGARPGLSLATIVAIAEILDVSIDYLVYGEPRR